MRRLGTALLAAALVAASGVAASTVAAAATPSAPPHSVGQARGLIVKKLPTVLARPLDLAAAAQAAAPGLEVAQTQVIGGGMDVVRFDQTVSVDQAAQAAAALSAQPGVAWAVPDTIKHLQATPTLPTDPFFNEQWDMWDSSQPNGGYSMKAPAAWSVTTGTGAVVAVVDTGIASHPDLNANVLPGYDFVSNVWSANDGNGWDNDPSDPGDWVTSSEAKAHGCGADAVSDSSWHGTHVSGTVAAVANNGKGISGAAPGAKVVPVRVMGKCGGLDSDIINGVLWAAGIHVPGVPDNTHPADVINLSLGGEQSCSADYQSAINQVRSAGVTVVAAAGNEGLPVSTSEPANCSGVISVGATGQDGEFAYYSNYGDANQNVTLVAPGGDPNTASDILSTVLLGPQGPTSTGDQGRSGPGYAWMDGTSMAAPHVAAAAALLYAAGPVTPDQVKSRLQSTAAPFPAGSGCSATKCGAGILDVSNLFGTPSSDKPSAPLNVVATRGNGQLTVTWGSPLSSGSSPITSYTATASPGGAACTTATTACVIKGVTNGTAYTVTVTASNASGTSGASNPSAAATPATVPGAIRSIRVTYSGSGSSRQANVSWAAPSSNGGSAITGYRIRLRAGNGAYGKPKTFRDPRVVVSPMTAGKIYYAEVTPVNAVGAGKPTAIRLAP